MKKKNVNFFLQSIMIFKVKKRTKIEKFNPKYRGRKSEKKTNKFQFPLIITFQMYSFLLFHYKATEVLTKEIEINLTSFFF